MDRPVLGITMGDPAGIGPEIVLKALAQPRAYELCRPVVVGSLQAMGRALDALGLDLELRSVSRATDASARPGAVGVIEAPALLDGEYRWGEVSPVAGDLAFAAVRNAIELALTNEIDGVVTAPLHKESLRTAGHDFPGHTEIFAHFTGAKQVAMMLAEGRLRIAHVSTHVSLREACERVTRDRVAGVIRLLHASCVAFGAARPRLGVAGLNPHASDGGLFGDEEETEIAPAVEACRAEGVNVEGPLPADTMFAKAIGGYFDGCVAMYHDQGHIPFKAAGFSWLQAEQRWSSVRGVNITLGLPIVRTSVDHGTAFDIAGRGVADATSLLNALECAAAMAVHRLAGRAA